MKRYEVVKRIVAMLLVCIMIISGINLGEKNAAAADTEDTEVTEDTADTEVRAVWFSYIEVEELLKDKSEKAFTKAFTQVCDNLLKNNCNTIYVHVRANADATYPSQYFPWSLAISSSGKALSYDPLSIMVSVAKSKGIQFYAWINPYRISSSTSKTTSLLGGTYYSSAYQSKFNEWYSSGIVTRQTYNGNDCLFFEPGNENARNLIVEGVKEIVTNYEVDGVIMDDYFYVWWTDADTANKTGAISARKTNVNKLVSSIYSAIKSVNPDMKFGISPEGNIESAERQGCDLQTWLSTSGYVDFIAPQLYWTDSYGSSGTTTMYSNRLNSWLALVENDTPVYPALAIYRAGEESSYDPGWTMTNANLQQQWSVALGKGCTGYSLFSYSYMLTDAGQQELTNLNGKNADYVIEDATVSYQTHIQNVGWQSLVSDGAIAGTTGKGYRLESINVSVDSEYSGSIKYCTHVQDIGWTDWVSNGKNSGTTGMGKRLEAIRIKLTGELAKKYDIYYRVHAQDYGWLGWAKNGGISGTTGKGKRLEAIQIVLVNKGEDAPGDTSDSNIQTLISYSTHVQNIGWQSAASDGELSGTSGMGLRLEAIKINLVNQKYSGEVTYRVHAQDYGWLGWGFNGEMAGTSGLGKRLEAIEINLTDEMAEHYDIVYRVHVQDYGWQDWVENGEMAGTTGSGKRLEAIQIKLVPKNN